MSLYKGKNLFDRNTNIRILKRPFKSPFFKIKTEKYIPCFNKILKKKEGEISLNTDLLTRTANNHLFELIQSSKEKEDPVKTSPKKIHKRIFSAFNTNQNTNYLSFNEFMKRTFINSRNSKSISNSLSNDKCLKINNSKSTLNIKSLSHSKEKEIYSSNRNVLKIKKKKKMKRCISQESIKLIKEVPKIYKQLSRNASAIKESLINNFNEKNFDTQSLKQYFSDNKDPKSVKNDIKNHIYFDLNDEKENKKKKFPLFKSVKCKDSNIITIRDSTANLINFGDHLELMEDNVFYLFRKYLFKKYPNLSKKAGLIVEDNQNKKNKEILKIEKNTNIILSLHKQNLKIFNNLNQKYNYPKTNRNIKSKLTSKFLNKNYFDK